MTVARITHPRPQLGRQRFLGIEFIDGFAEVNELHPERKQAILQHGFTIETLTDGGMFVDIGVPTDVDRDPAFIDLTKLKLPELRDIAGVEGIDFPAKATKAALIELISLAPAAPATAPNAGEQIPYLAAHIIPLEADEE